MWVGYQVFIDFLILDMFNLIGLFSPTLVISRKFITLIKNAFLIFLDPRISKFWGAHVFPFVFFVYFFGRLFLKGVASHPIHHPGYALESISYFLHFNVNFPVTKLFPPQK